MKKLLVLFFISVLCSCASQKQGNNAITVGPQPPKPALIEKAKYQIVVNQIDGVGYYVVQIVDIIEVGRGVPLLSSNDSIKIQSRFPLELKKFYKVLVSPPRPVRDEENHVWRLIEIL